MQALMTSLVMESKKVGEEIHTNEQEIQALGTALRVLQRRHDTIAQTVESCVIIWAGNGRDENGKPKSKAGAGRMDTEGKKPA